MSLNPVDVLIHAEVGVDPLTYAIALTRSAPLQVAFWGNPMTTGMPWSIDYFIVGVHHRLSAQQKTLFSEQIVELSGFAAYYYRPSFPKLGRSINLMGKSMEEEEAERKDSRIQKLLTKLRGGGGGKGGGGGGGGSPPILASVQSLVKVHPSFDCALRTLLVDYLPDAHVILLAGRSSIWSYQFQERIKRLAALHNDDDMSTFSEKDTASLWTDRVHVLRRLPASEYAVLLKEADVLLDSFPYSGFTTSIEGLALGMPIVTLDVVGTSLRGSQTSSLYRTMGSEQLEECCVASSIGEWVEKVVRMAKNVDYRERARNEVRTHSSLLFEDQSVVESWSKFLVRVHQSRCLEGSEK